MKHATTRLLSLLSLSLGLACLPMVGHTKDEPTPLTVDASFNPADAASKGFTVADTTALKGIKRVAVPVFAVEFITADNVSAQTSGFASAGRATSSLYYKLLGVGEPDFQAITDSLYQRFLEELRSSGWEVLEVPQIVAAPTYSKLVASGSPAPIKSDTTMMMSPPGLGIYGFATMDRGNSNKSKSLFGALSNVGSGFAAVGAVMDTVTLATELDATLIEVRMRVNFVQLANNNKGFLGRLSGTASTTGKAFPSVENVMMGVQTGQMRSTLTMKNTLTLDSTAFSEVREKAATKGDIAGAVAVGLLRMAIGSNDSSSSSEMEVIADPANYRKVIENGLMSAGSMLIARIKQER